MPLFRFHKGSLEESLKTTIIVRSKLQLYNILLWKMAHENNNPFPFVLKIFPYPDEKINFDERIGWYTQMVTSDMYERGNFHPVGFLSEPFPETT